MSGHLQIDWQKGYTFLDQELQSVVQDAELGKRFVDKLVQVNRLSGQEDWIYIHLEVQGTAQAEFAERIFVYNYRIYDRYHRPVASMAVLADDTPSWKPQEFSYEVLGCNHSLQFPVAKLLDYADRVESLENDPNPFALVTLAHLQTRATRSDPQARYAAKWRLVQLLYRRGWSKVCSKVCSKACSKVCRRVKPWLCKSCSPNALVQLFLLLLIKLKRLTTRKSECGLIVPLMPPAYRPFLVTPHRQPTDPISLSKNNNPGHAPGFVIMGTQAVSLCKSTGDSGASGRGCDTVSLPSLNEPLPLPR